MDYKGLNLDGFEAIILLVFFDKEIKQIYLHNIK